METTSSPARFANSKGFMMSAVLPALLVFYQLYSEKIYIYPNRRCGVKWMPSIMVEKICRVFEVLQFKLTLPKIRLFPDLG